MIRQRRHGGFDVWLRRLALLTVAAWPCIWPQSAAAQAPELLRYEPPAVDAVYPEPGPEDSAAPTPSEPTTVPEPAPAAPTTGPATPPASPVVGPAPEYGAQAKIKRPAARGTRQIDMKSARDLPGSFGDPLRILDSLPGVVPLTSGLPYVYIRGAPPAAQGFFYDDIPLPLLFHAAFGPAVLHPRTTGSVRLYAGVPEARYGRRVGGALLAEGTPQGDKFAAELELRLIDMGAWVETPVGDGTLTVSGRIGYPKLALLAAQSAGIVDSGLSVNYADGQLRFKHPLGKRDTLELVYLGSFDNVNLPGLSNDPRAGASKLEFHRVETRLVRRVGDIEVGTAARFGFDASELGSALSVRAFTFGPRMWTRIKLGRHVLRAGADLYGSKGQIINRDGVIASPDGDLRINVPTIAQASARNQGGAYLQGSFWLGEDTLLDVGLRLDYWSVQSRITFAGDPRIRLTHDLNDAWAVHAAFGMAHQPAVFLLPTPGLTDVALDKGLMRSFQSEAGVDYQITRSTHVEMQAFLHHYDDLLLLELIQDGAVPENPPLVSANSYGIETFLKRDMSERLSGWISYTLAYAVADSGPGVVGKFKPDFDVRHVLNTVGSYRIWRGLTLGARMQARSGRVVEQLNPRYTQRLPWFVRMDARVGYAWRSRYADMTAYLEWLNVFATQEYTDADCLLGVCRAKPAPVIALPNLGIRAEF